jgi:hypothetical protein
MNVKVPVRTKPTSTLFGVSGVSYGAVNRLTPGPAMFESGALGSMLVQLHAGSYVRDAIWLNSVQATLVSRRCRVRCTGGTCQEYDSKIKRWPYTSTFYSETCLD